MISAVDMGSFRSTSREVIRLSLPALGSLLVVPLLTFTDSALAGYLGTTPLAAITLASTLISFFAGMAVFLTYSSTTVCGQLNETDGKATAISRGSQYIWLGFLLGALICLLFCFYAESLIGIFSDDTHLVKIAATYAIPASFLLPADLAFMALNGVLRGLGNTKFPFYISLLGVGLNLPLSSSLIFFTNLGLIGLAIGSTLSSWVMILVALIKLNNLSKSQNCSIAPSLSEFKQIGFSGLALLIRSSFLWGSGLLTIKAAGLGGSEIVAAHQIVQVLWRVSAFAMDAIAIAAQILFAQSIKWEHSKRQELVKSLIVITLFSGIIWSLIFLISPLFWPILFSATKSVWSVSTMPLIIAGICQPIVSLVYLYDGILMGEGKFWNLAKLYGMIFFFHAPVVVIPYLIWGNGFGGLILVWAVYAGWLQFLRLIFMTPAMYRLYNNK